MKRIHFWIEKRAFTYPNRIAIITEQEEITYGQLNELINRYVAFLLEKNVKQGDRIAILSHNRYEFIVLLFAIAKLQCVAVPLNVRLNMHELEYQLRDSGTTLLFIEEEFDSLRNDFEQIEALKVVNMNLLKKLPTSRPYTQPINESVPFIICYTSGTTGKPKGAVLTQKNMYYNAINNALTLHLTSHDRTIVLLPLFHIGGIGLFAFPTLFVGGTIVIGGKFVPDKALELIEKHRVTIVMGVPSIHQALLDSSYFEKVKLSSVRWFYSGGAPCPQELINEFYENGYLFGQGFGLTETSPTVFLLSEEDAPRKTGSVGKPVLYCDVKIVDDDGNPVAVGEIGHLIVSGGNVMKEYWNNPIATNEAFRDGWFHTGDLARFDEEGFFYIVGRKKEMIISGGENIYPIEIESIINRMQEVKEVAVVGIPDTNWGEVPIAFVSTIENSTLEGEEVIHFCKQYLGKYKVPKEVQFLKELPKNSTGKIDKKKLTIEK